MTPDVFWGLSMREWRAAMRGYADHYGAGSKAPGKGDYPPPPKKADVERQVAELKAKGLLN